jgi:hypothetical protein
VFPRGDRPIAVEWPGHAVITLLHPIVGLEFVEETVTVLGVSTELAHHLFRECWLVGTGSDTLTYAGRSAASRATRALARCWASRPSSPTTCFGSAGNVHAAGLP